MPRAADALVAIDNLERPRFVVRGGWLGCAPGDGGMADALDRDCVNAAAVQSAGAGVAAVQGGRGSVKMALDGSDGHGQVAFDGEGADGGARGRGWPRHAPVGARPHVQEGGERARDPARSPSTAARRHQATESTCGNDDEPPIPFARHQISQCRRVGGDGCERHRGHAHDRIGVGPLASHAAAASARPIPRPPAGGGCTAASGPL